MKHLFFILLIGVMSCKQNNNNTNNPNQNLSSNERTPYNSNVYGNYVDNSYVYKDEGYDWVAVTIKEHDKNTIAISIRSRADKKTPTCTFDAKAYKIEENKYETFYNGNNIRFEFLNNSINISTSNEKDSGVLYFFCNGGATIAGTYTKIDGDLDTNQVDQTSFSAVLFLQDIGFNISTIEKEEKNILSIYTFGLNEQDYNESFEIIGEQVVDAEVEDLNSDGSPDLFVYTQSDGSGSFGNVYAFSVNNKKSMSQVYFQPTAENPLINQGYMGHDEFKVVENRLVQRFPIYKSGDSNANPTGGTRQITYKLEDGEAMRKLVVEDAMEY